MAISYTCVLRLAVWAEPAERAEAHLADWVDHLEEFRANHSRLQFWRELALGFVSHVGSRLFHVRPAAFTLPLISVLVAMMFTPVLSAGIPASGFMLVLLNAYVAIGVLAMLRALKHHSARRQSEVFERSE